MSTTSATDLSTEWLEPDGLGGFASGTVGGIRSRRYHALLLVARRPPTDRVVLVNGFDAWIEQSAGSESLTAQHYLPDVVTANSSRRLIDFTIDPWPTWLWQLPGGIMVRQELFVPHGRPAVVLSWDVQGAPPGTRLRVRPFLSGRDYHALQRENSLFQEPRINDLSTLTCQPYPDLPSFRMAHNGRVDHIGLWYRQFRYAEEEQRGLDFVEDLAAPYDFVWETGVNEPAILILEGLVDSHHSPSEDLPVVEKYIAWKQSERTRRNALASTDRRAADAYLVRRGDGQSIVAGYPWFTDWGRDTFIAMRGLCLALNNLAAAGQILEAWSGTVSEGMLPNRFPDGTADPEFNSVDASLWFVIAVHDYFDACERSHQPIPATRKSALQEAVSQILCGYADGTRYGIRADTDGLLAAGEPGVQLTWMDAKVGDWVVTPRIGKPVEVQTLWLNALWIASQWETRWKKRLDQGAASFKERFWNEEAGCLFDIVDVDHVAGQNDAEIRPNQIFAVGGLPFSLLEGTRAQQVVAMVEQHLLTPAGLRTLAPSSPNYRGRYAGGVLERDGAYHQGTVWPWLMGAFVDAWLAVHGRTSETIAQAKDRFVAPLERLRETHGLGHVPEVAWGDPPHHPGGCPFQAWSLGELMRIKYDLLSVSRERPV